MHYDFFYSSNGGEMLGLVLFYVLYMIAVCGFGIVMYVFRSLGVYTVAKRRGLKHAWFAWVPVADHYLLGCISDQYRYVVKGQNKNKRKILLILDIAFVLCLAVFVAFFVGIAVRGMMGRISESRMLSQLMNGAGIGMALLAVGIAMTVLRYMALYDLYVSVEPKNSTMYLVLSILFRVTEPFFIFFSRNKDEGMPPRKDPEPQVWTEEPWVNE